MGKLIIWDWNGTLLNDVGTCVEAMNVMLQERNMGSLNIDKYKKIFTFPVQNYYKLLGFDFEKEPFEDLSVEYINLYKQFSEKAPLQMGVLEALKYFQSKDYKQIILSASEQVALEYQVRERGIEDYFDSILGLNNIYAKSKLDNAIAYINNSSTDFNQIILVGDTYHDYEVAQAIGAECILIENGHQDLNQFSFDGQTEIINNLFELDIKQKVEINPPFN